MCLAAGVPSFGRDDVKLLSPTYWPIPWHLCGVHRISALALLISRQRSPPSAWTSPPHNTPIVHPGLLALDASFKRARTRSPLPMGAGPSWSGVPSYAVIHAVTSIMAILQQPPPPAFQRPQSPAHVGSPEPQVCFRYGRPRVGSSFLPCPFFLENSQPSHWPLHRPWPILPVKSTSTSALSGWSRLRAVPGTQLFVGS